MSHFWGKLTVKGSDRFEETLTQLLQEIRESVSENFPPASYKALLLIGGYGKGEGGVEIIQGIEKPHNNFDLLLITQKNDLSLEYLKVRLDNLLKPISQRYDINLETSVVPFQQLKRSSPPLIWYEMFQAHKVIAGDSNFTSSLPSYRLNDVAEDEFLTLLVNRGTLLIINLWLIKAGLCNTTAQRKVIIKHTMKAIIGFGDALLYFLGDYHWSYQEKQKFMRNRQDISPDFKDLYESATTFRFQPDYAAYLSKDLNAWMHELLSPLAEIFLQIESIRLENPLLTWDNYFSLFLKKSWGQNLFSKRGITEKIKGILTLPKSPCGEGWQEKSAFCLLSPQQKTAFIFPVIAFSVGPESLASQVKEYLKADSNNLEEKYLIHWGQSNDPNFFHSMEDWKKTKINRSID